MQSTKLAMTGSKLNLPKQLHLHGEKLSMPKNLLKKKHAISLVMVEQLMSRQIRGSHG